MAPWRRNVLGLSAMAPSGREGEGGFTIEDLGHFAIQERRVFILFVAQVRALVLFRDHFVGDDGGDREIDTG